MEVIGAGFGRTGTYSTKLALEELGYKCHHMEAVFTHGQAKQWQAISRGIDVEKNLLDVTDGFTACLDFPTCGYFEDYMRLYPDAKILLTCRDSPEAWVKSANQTIMKVAFDNKFSSGLFYHSLKWVPIFGQFIRIGNFIETNFNKCAVGNFVPKYPENRVQYYEDWYAHVRRTVPKEKLLEFNVKQGWEPLCKFLGKPVPNKPFPRGNNTDDFEKRIKMQKIINYSCLVLIYGGLGYLTYSGKIQCAFSKLKALAIQGIQNGPVQTWAAYSGF